MHADAALEPPAVTVTSTASCLEASQLLFVVHLVLRLQGPWLDILSA
jgi:hypothetical protein